MDSASSSSLTTLFVILSLWVIPLIHLRYFILTASILLFILFDKIQLSLPYNNISLYTVTFVHLLTSDFPINALLRLWYNFAALLIPSLISYPMLPIIIITPTYLNMYTYSTGTWFYFMLTSLSLFPISITSVSDFSSSVHCSKYYTACNKLY